MRGRGCGLGCCEPQPGGCERLYLRTKNSASPLCTDSGILDTPEEQRFDRLTRLAAGILRVPVALVSLVDRERQWFKSAHGVEVRQTPRETSFCAHAVAARELLVVPDATC